MAEYTAKGTLKRDADAPKTQPAATPEEKAARIAEARAKALAAKAAGGSAPARPAAAAAPVAAEESAAPVAPAPVSDGMLRTAKGTIKRDPNAPKTQLPSSPEERAARLAEAKAKAAAAKAAREAGGGTPGGLQPGAAAAAQAAAVQAGPSDALSAERRRIFDIVTRPVPGAEPLLRPIVHGKERVPARQEFTISEEMEDTVRFFRDGLRGVNIEVLSSPLDVVLVVDRADLLKVMQHAKHSSKLDMKLLRFISGVDQMEEGIEITYGLKSLTTRRGCLVKTLVPLTDPVVDSVVSVWKAAEWHERETREMFGVQFRGHPDPRNLLLDEDMTIHPLRKAHPLQELELKQGVNVF